MLKSFAPVPPPKLVSEMGRSPIFALGLPLGSKTQVRARRNGVRVLAEKNRHSTFFR